MLGIRVVSYRGEPLPAPLGAAFGEAGGDIGRATHCTLTLPDPEREISRRQALIRHDGQRFLIRGIGTHLAVELDGVALQIDVEHPIEIGAHLRIGAYALLVEAAATLPAQALEFVDSDFGEVDLLINDAAPSVPAALAAASAAASPATPAAAPSSSSGAALVAALYEGLGLPTPEPGGQTPQQLRLIGALLRQSIEGTLELLATRAIAKRELGAGATVPHARENNPLKFSLDAETALAHLLGPTQRGFIGPVAAVGAAMNDLRAHDVAVLATMRAGLDEVMARFDPTALERQLAPTGSLEKLLPGSRESKLWSHYARRYGQIVQDLETDLDALLARAFHAAYEAQLAHAEKGDPGRGPFVVRGPHDID